MNIDKSFEPLVNYFSGSAKIRPQYKEYVATPTYCQVTEGLFRNKQAKDIYIENLYEVMGSRTVSPKFNKFDNNTVSAHWTTLHIDGILKNLNEFPEKVQLHTQQIVSFAEIHGIDITNNLKNIDTILDTYNNDPKIIETKNYLIQKLAVVDEWDKAIVTSTRALIETAKTHNTERGNIDFYQYDNNIDTNPDLVTMKKFIDEKSGIFENNRTGNEPDWCDLSPINEYINKLNAESMDAYIKIRNAGVELRFADTFLAEHQSPSSVGNISGFLKDKIKDDEQEWETKYRLCEFDGNRIKAILLFKDSTMLLKKSDNTYQDIFTRQQLHEAKKIIVADHVRSLFKKNPTVAKNFIEIIEKDPDLINLRKANVAIETYHNNLEFFNNKSFDIRSEFKEALSTHKNNVYRAIEQLDDRMHKKIKDHKILLFAHSIASNKYRGLYNKETYKIIEGIYDLKLKSDVFQEYIGKKIAAYKTPEEFNEGLSKFLSSFNSFEMNAMTNKAEEAGARIISQEDNILILGIDDYEQSKLLGSSSWCIVRDDHYFRSYTNNGNQQYFVFDFSKDSADEASMLGITLDKRGDYHAAHFKDDSEMEEDDEMIMYLQDKLNEISYKNNLKTSLDNKTRLNI